MICVDTLPILWHCHQWRVTRICGLWWAFFNDVSAIFCQCHHSPIMCYWMKCHHRLRWHIDLVDTVSLNEVIQDEIRLKADLRHQGYNSPQVANVSLSFRPCLFFYTYHFFLYLVSLFTHSFILLSLFLHSVSLFTPSLSFYTYSPSFYI